jgi:putative SOS response-associated peptidase YedK
VWSIYLTVDPGDLQKLIPELWYLPMAACYNISPTQPVAVIPHRIRLIYVLIPSWAKDPEIGSRMINARAETLAEKPSFRNSFRRKRCLILADGFYEWKQSESSKTKQPMYIYMKNRKPFAFAGLWDLWHAPDGSEVYSAQLSRQNQTNY